MEEETIKNEATLSGLVEQAACCFTTLSPGDLSDVQQLQDLLRQIDQVATELDRSPTDVQPFKRTTGETIQVLQQVLRQETEDTGKALEMVSTAICTLQNLICGLVEPQGGENPSLAHAPAAPVQDTEPSGPTEMTIPEEDAPLVLDFIAEANEHIETAESGLLELEGRPDDHELVNKVFRAFHTIKGMAGFLNLAEIQSLAHSAENLLDLARKGKLALTGQTSDAAFESIDALKKMLGGLKGSLESGAPVVAFDPLPQLLERIKAAAEGTPVLPPPVVVSEKADRKLDAILEDSVDTRKPKASGASATHAADDKIKVSTTRLDSLINLAGELVIAQLMVTEELQIAGTSQHGMARKVAHQGKIVRELQELSMSMRMVPIQGVFQKMSRLARDLMRKAAKPVDFVTDGEETELDRTVVDRIADPLVHMVRNAIDHGIESAEDRARAGKDPTGHVELRAFHQAGNIVIQLEDDGKGLDKDRILKKAVENGLIEPGQDLPEEEIFKLILHPGLSTAEKITSVSGRGVGMDVVKKNIESLRGRIDISSTLGKGTVFTIHLPLTLAVIDGQVVRIGDARYIIPINAIVRSLRPTREQISSIQGRGEMILERGELIPLVRLFQLLEVTPLTQDPTEALVVIVEDEGRRCCLLVDDLLAQQQVVIKSLGEALGRVRGVSGGSIAGDGRVILILDIPGLIRLAQER